MRLRTCVLTIPLLSCLLVAGAPDPRPLPADPAPRDRAAAPGSPRSSPAAHAALAKAYLQAAIPPADWQRVLFLSFYATDSPDLEVHHGQGRFWVHSLSREAAITLPPEVPGSDGRLYLLYIDDYGWTRPAVNAVVAREPFFSADAVGCATAEFLRQAVGFADPGHAGAIVQAEWFIHDTSDTTLSPSYYDLLYARERFPVAKAETTVAKAATGKAAAPRYPAATAAARELIRAAGDPAKDFPVNEADFQFAFAAEQAVKLSFDPKRRLEIDHGVIVDEGDSIVAYHERLLVRVRTPVGAFHKAYDSKTSAGGKDLIEFRNLKGTVRYDKLKIDAAEMITNNAAGGQVYLLTDGAGKRAEFADPLTVARDTTDAYRPVVRTPRSCVICHARGINTPRSLMLAGLAAGIKPKFKDYDLARRVQSFLITPTASVIAEDQARYSAFVKQTSGLGPEQNAAAYKRLLDRYEAKLDVERMAAESGLSVFALQDLARRLPAFRAQAITQDLLVPRTIWEQDVYPELMLLIQLIERRYLK